MILGTVQSINGSDMTLLIDGETEPTTKEYKQSGFCAPKAGDRVTIEEISGSYVVTGIIGKSMRYTVPLGTTILEINLEPGKNYLVSWYECISTSSTIAARMAMVSTPPSGYASTATTVNQFAESGSTNPFTGLSNFRLKISKVSSTRIGYASVMEL